MSDIMKFSPLWGDWYIKNQVGKGTFGTVYRAERTEYGNTYVSAIKHIEIPAAGISDAEVIAEGLATDEVSVSAYYNNVRDKLLSEIQTCYQLKGNTNIVSYEDHLVIPKENGRGYDVFIRMEFLQSLPEYMQCNPITAERVIDLGINLCDALSLLNKRNIIHRDIKPANIFVNNDGVFKLGDFGESKILSQTTGGMSVKGTYTYMPPEIFHGGAVNKTADIYSLGMVMYRLLNDNRPPFSPPLPTPINADIVQESNTRRFKGEPLPPLTNPNNLQNMGLVKIILKACEANPANRWQTAEELKQALIQVRKNPNMVMDSFDKTVSQTAVNNRAYNDGYTSDGMGTNANNGGFANVQAYNAKQSAGGSRLALNNQAGAQPVPKKSSNKALVAVITILIVVLLAVIGVGAAVVYPMIKDNNISISSTEPESTEGTQDPTEEYAPTDGETTYPVEESTYEAPQADMVTVESYENKPYTEVQAALEGMGLVVNVDYESSDTVEKNNVVSQSIEPGTSVEKGSMITIVASNGPAVCPYEYSQKVVVKSTGSNSNATLTMYSWGEGEWEEIFSCDAKVGSNGVGDNYGEGKKVTPKGTFKLGVILSASSLSTNMNTRVVTNTTCVVDDVSSPLYNTIQDTEFLSDDTSRDVIGKKLCNGTNNALIYIEHNGDGITTSGVVPGDGSAITICGCTGSLSATAGCIDISSEDMNVLISNLDSYENPHIEIS